ncbi:hypothetical protein [Bradyrhizobium lupini]|uniref:hypothetical protein n=1 Tax=Rhizobium lupini TaxID=136996 RepID=UPI0034C6A99A
MTDTENLAAGALSAGIDLIVPPPTMSDIKATAAELLAHIDNIHMSTEGSLWLKNARANVRAVLLCIDSHLAEFEEKEGRGRQDRGQARRAAVEGGRGRSRLAHARRAHHLASYRRRHCRAGGRRRIVGAEGRDWEWGEEIARKRADLAGFVTASAAAVLSEEMSEEARGSSPSTCFA